MSFVKEYYESDTLRILQLVKDGWSYQRSVSQCGFSLRYANYLRKQYPEFDAVILKNRKERSFKYWKLRENQNDNNAVS